MATKQHGGVCRPAWRCLKHEKWSKSKPKSGTPDHQEIEVVPVPRACGGRPPREIVVVVDVIEQRLECVGVVLLDALVHRHVRVVLVCAQKHRKYGYERASEWGRGWVE